MPNHQYDDISDLPRPVSRRHRPMPIEERAVQFAPFAALACYEEILMEVARSTQECPQLSEDEQTRLDALLQQLRGRLQGRPWVTVTWFVPDEKKAGGNCVTTTGQAMLRNRLEPEKGVFIAESPTVIGLALDAGYEPLALLTERKFIEGKAAGIIARCGEIPLYTGEREVLARLTGYELTRGVLCAMRRPRPKDFREVCAGTRRVAVLENVVDSTNVGAIIRSAAALGIDAVLLTPSCCDPLNRRAVRVSMGTVFQIPWVYIGEQPADWPSPGLDWLNELG